MKMVVENARELYNIRNYIIETLESPKLKDVKPKNKKKSRPKLVKIIKVLCYTKKIL